MDSRLCSLGTTGHTGFTGTGLWIDFDKGKAWTLLTSRIHPTRHFNSGIVALRQPVGGLVNEPRAHDPEPKDRASEKWKPAFASLTSGLEKIMLKQENRSWNQSGP